MKFNHFAYIFLGPNISSNPIRKDIKTDAFTFTTIGLDFKNKADCVEIAKSLIDEGVQLIELCGGFGPIWIAKISEALNFAVPVGSVAYGPEARKPLVDLLS